MNSSNATQGIYKTTDGGATFVQCPMNGSGGPITNFHGNQGWYNNSIGVSPVNDSIVLCGGVSVLRTYNGFDFFEIDAKHADQHAMAFSPNGAEMFAGNDGGVFYSNNGGINFNAECTDVVVDWQNNQNVYILRWGPGLFKSFKRLLLSKMKMKPMKTKRKNAERSKAQSEPTKPELMCSVETVTILMQPDE